MSFSVTQPPYADLNQQATSDGFRPPLRWFPPVPAPEGKAQRSMFADVMGG
ncbi:hypothetical protein ECBCE034MS14_1634 [Escherichia coli BCE034_MS-14]|nr:hypothetical protein ECBCE034MS14_1634 [Escherichia coli BCE034_MS-14]